MPITIVIADDDIGVLDAICDALDEDGRFEVVATARDAPSALSAVEQHRPDAVLLDVRMPGSGVDAATAIHRLGLPITIMVASAGITANEIAELLRAGVRGIFAKGRLGDSLGRLISRCCAGEVLLLVTSGAEGLRLYGRTGG